MWGSIWDHNEKTFLTLTKSVKTQQKHLKTAKLAILHFHNVSMKCFEKNHRDLVEIKNYAMQKKL